MCVCGGGDAAVRRTPRGGQTGGAVVGQRDERRTKRLEREGWLGPFPSRLPPPPCSRPSLRLTTRAEAAEGGASLARWRANKPARAHHGDPARGKCHRGGSSSAGKWFPLLFCPRSYIIEKATQHGPLGGCPPSCRRGGGGLMTGIPKDRDPD